LNRTGGAGSTSSRADVLRPTAAHRRTRQPPGRHPAGRNRCRDAVAASFGDEISRPETGPPVRSVAGGG